MGACSRPRLRWPDALVDEPAHPRRRSTRCSGLSLNLINGYARHVQPRAPRLLGHGRVRRGVAHRCRCTADLPGAAHLRAELPLRDGRRGGRRARSSASPACGCAATTSRSPRSASARSCASRSRTRNPDVLGGSLGPARPARPDGGEPRHEARLPPPDASRSSSSSWRSSRCWHPRTTSGPRRGARMLAVAQDETAAGLLGINPTRSKVIGVRDRLRDRGPRRRALRALPGQHHAARLQLHGDGEDLPHRRARRPRVDLGLRHRGVPRRRRSSSGLEPRAGASIAQGLVAGRVRR